MAPFLIFYYILSFFATIKQKSIYFYVLLHILLMVICMILLIGNMDNRIKEFIKNAKFTKRMMMINKMCNVKTIKEDVDVIIPYGIINQFGLISSTNVHLEELLISLDVRKLYYTNPYNKPILERLKQKYHFDLIYLEIVKSNNSINFVF